MTRDVFRYAIPGRSNSSILLTRSNVLDMEGMRVIHCSRCFDTDVSIVRAGSVLHQFISFAVNANVDIDSQIDAWTMRIATRGVRRDNLPFRKTAFAPGELCPLTFENEIICLSAFCHTIDPYVSEELSLQEYFDYWQGLWRNLSLMSIRKDIVNVTVPGGNFINVSGAPLSIEQSIGIALLTYFRHIQMNHPIKQLNICLGQKNAIDTDAWHKAVIPFIYGLTNMPLSIAPALNCLQVVSPASANCSGATDYMTVLADDLKNFFNALSTHNGERFAQFEGSKRVNILVNVDSGSLSTIVDSLKSHPSLSAYFGKAKGANYDRNSVYEILGVLIEATNLFGGLNRRSVIILGSAGDNNYTRQIIGDNLDNAINYVGQRLKKFKTLRYGLYNEFFALIPENMRR